MFFTKSVAISGRTIASNTSRARFRIRPTTVAATTNVTSRVGTVVGEAVTAIMRCPFDEGAASRDPGGTTVPSPVSRSTGSAVPI